MALPWSWHIFGGTGEERVEVMAFFFSLEMDDNFLEKIMKTLTPKGVFIGFPIGLKWLEPIKDLSHLIYHTTSSNWLIKPTWPTN